MPDLRNAEMLKGIYLRHCYPWHAHEELTLGVVVGGAIKLRTRSNEGIAKSGSFVLINAEEMHQGSPCTAEGWRCRTIHVVTDIVRSVAEEIKRYSGTPVVRFGAPTFEDADLAHALLELHRCSETASSSSLERQSRIVALIAHLLERHTDAAFEIPTASRETLAVGRARAYLDENTSLKVTLDDLAIHAGVTPFRLLRAFQRTVGATPHSYQMQARVRMAHAMLRRRESLAEVAAAAGFADQAHLTRVFKTIMGATPGQYRAAALAGAIEIAPLETGDTP